MTQATDAQRGALDRDTSAEVLLGFLEITHPALSPAIRLVSDVLDHDWGGHLWTACAFGYTLVDDGDGAPRTVLRTPNVSRQAITALRAVNRPRAKAALTVLSSADFDLSVVPRVAQGTPAPIYRMTGFEVVDAVWDAETWTAEMTVALRDDASQPWPYLRATRDRLPGVGR